MKRFLLLSLAAALLIGCLAACGDAAQTAQNAFNDALDGLDVTIGDNDETDDGDVSLEDLLSGKGTPDVESLSPAEKAALTAQAAAEGVDLSFGDGGSMTVKNTDGSVTTYDGDGNWSFKGADGEVAQLGGDWPDNKFTRLVPKPDMKVGAFSADDDECTVVFVGATLEQIKAYGAKIKSAGFEVEEETDVAGVYMLDTTKDDYTVQVTFSAGTASLIISYDGFDE